jgi:hypothetical protein
VGTLRVVAVVLLGVLGLAVFVGSILGVVVLAMRGFAGASGLKSLVERFSAGQEPPNAVRGRTLRIGAVQFQRCVTVALTEEALYLSVRTFGGSRSAALIPWSQVRLSGEGTLYWRATHRFTMGEPPIATVELFEDLWRLVEPHLVSVTSTR